MRCCLIVTTICIFITTHLSAQITYKKNDQVEINNSGTWVPAEVVAVEGDKYRIHYIGYPTAWDEVVETSRMRRIPAVSQPVTTHLSAQITYKKSDQVEVSSGGVWWKAEIVAVEGNKYKIHYIGWSDISDEVVDTSRIRRTIITPPSKPVTSTSPTVKTTFRKGDRVMAKGENDYSYFYEASIIEVSGGKYKVRWERSDSPDEWKTAGQLKPFDFGKTAGGPIPGKYMCYLIGASMGGQKPTYTGTIEILANGKYQYQVGRPGETRGTYKFNEQTRRVTWTSGSLANKEGIFGEYTNTKKDGAFISLVFPPGKRKGYIQECKCDGKVINFIDSPYKY